MAPEPPARVGDDITALDVVQTGRAEAIDDISTNINLQHFAVLDLFNRKIHVHQNKNDQVTHSQCDLASKHFVAVRRSSRLWKKQNFEICVGHSACGPGKDDYGHWSLYTTL